MMREAQSKDRIGEEKRPNFALKTFFLFIKDKMLECFLLMVGLKISENNPLLF